MHYFGDVLRLTPVICAFAETRAPTKKHPHERPYQLRTLPYGETRSDRGVDMLGADVQKLYVISRSYSSLSLI